MRYGCIGKFIRRMGSVQGDPIPTACPRITDAPLKCPQNNNGVLSWAPMKPYKVELAFNKDLDGNPLFNSPIGLTMSGFQGPSGSSGGRRALLNSLFHKILRSGRRARA